MAWLWWIAVVGGPLLLILLIIWATLRTRTSSRNVAASERGARELREELSREDETRG